MKSPTTIAWVLDFSTYMGCHGKNHLSKWLAIMTWVYTDVGHLSELKTIYFRWEVDIIELRILLDKHLFHGCGYNNSSGNQKMWCKFNPTMTTMIISMRIYLSVGHVYKSNFQCDSIYIYLCLDWKNAYWRGLPLIFSTKNTRNKL